MAVHTHYDNLKVMRKAPLEVIRAAYRAMAQKYHPDLNPSLGATEVMRILNEAWEVLRDPVKRANHDTWIAQQEAIDSERKQEPPKHASAQGWTDGPRTYSDERERPFAYKRPEGHRAQASGGPQAQASDASKPRRGSGFTVNEAVAKKVKSPTWTLKRICLGAGVLTACWLFAAAAGFSWVGPHVTASNAAAAPIEASVPPPGEPNYARCAGSYEPEKCRQAEQRLAAETSEEANLRRAQLANATARARAAVQGVPESAPQTQPTFVPGDFDVAVVAATAEDPALLRGPSRHLGKVLARGGHSVIQIDNSDGTLDTEVRLYREGRKPHVRSMLVRKGTSFSSTGIASGSYVVRWRVLGSQSVYEADERAVLEEEKTERGVRYSNVRMTLFQVRSGNLRTSPVPESEF